MTRFDRVIQILDESIGGPGVNIAVHGAFWRGVTRDQFVVKKVQGLDLLVLGDGSGSNVVKALKGESPFGQDLDNPPPGARFDRMPSGLDPALPANIAFIQKWIDDRCPEDAFVAQSRLSWRPTNAPLASSRTDDIWFVDPQTGWAANSNGQIVKTTDGGNAWTEQLHDDEVYFRCLGFASATRGWAGTLTTSKTLFETKNGGTTWTAVTNLPPNPPSAICGMSVVSDKVVFVAGTNFPNRPPRMMKTTDGGATWTAIDMRPWASILIDTFFTSPTRGWVVGGKTDQVVATRANVKPVVLVTKDGGQTWENRVAALTAQLPLGEWGWKIQFLDEHVGFVSLENFKTGAILKTTDGGITWTRLPINDPQKNANLEGVGFVDEKHGWVGGWGDAQFQRLSSSETMDGGLTWTDANEIGRALNRFRFFGKPVRVGYASGQTVYKYTDQPVTFAAVAGGGHLLITAAQPEIHAPSDAVALNVPQGAGTLTVRIWDRFGDLVAKPVEEPNPAPGARTLYWDGKNDAGQALDPGHFIMRVTVDERSESTLVRLAPSGPSQPNPPLDGERLMANAYVLVAGSGRRLLPGSKLLGHCNPNERVELALKLRRKAPLPELTDRPKVPLSREESAATYGAAKDDIARVEDCMRKWGLEVLASDEATRTVEVAGPIKILEEVFQVKLFEYSHPDRDYRGRSGVIHIPSEVDGLVVGVYGLDNRQVIHRRRRMRSRAATFPLATTSMVRGFLPAKLAGLYDFPPGDGAGQTIGILEFGGGFLPDDLDLFCHTAGVKVPTVIPVSVDRSPTDTDDDAAGEVMLDIEVIAGACPGATQVVYFGSGTFDEKAWIDTLGKAIHDQVHNPFILSISWGSAEDFDRFSDGTPLHVNDSFQEAAMMGITICVASGDDGSADETDFEPSDGSLDGRAHVDFPAASPFVLAVGGTDLRIGPSGIVTERAWKDGNGRRRISRDSTGTGGATGGGVSTRFARPAFQSGITIKSVNPGTTQGRVVPDVAAHAESDGRTRGYFWVLDGQGSPNGGTSAAAPLWAALIARMNAILQQELGAGKRVGYLTPLLYKNDAAGQTIGTLGCKDIVSGNNISAAIGGYSSKVGFDAVTGWGSPVGNKLLAAIKPFI